MSISIWDIETTSVPERGIIPPSFEAELHLAQSIPITRLPPGTPEQRTDYVRWVLFNRVYGDLKRYFRRYEELAKGDTRDDAASAEMTRLAQKMHLIFSGECRGTCDLTPEEVGMTQST